MAINDYSLDTVVSSILHAKEFASNELSMLAKLSNEYPIEMVQFKQESNSSFSSTEMYVITLLISKFMFYTF